MRVAVAIERVEKRFGSLLALAGVSLQIAEGEFFGLLGPNGAGKTTLISCLAGLSRPDAGKLMVMGHDVLSDYRSARRLLGVVPQELVFDPFFSVRETLRIQSGYFGIRHNEDWIDEILANLDLTAKADTNMRRLSGGMKRRVLVAQALVHKPPVIVLDEPTAGVDVELRQGLWQFVRRLNRDGHTVILTTHYLEEAEALWADCDAQTGACGGSGYDQQPAGTLRRPHFDPAPGACRELPAMLSARATQSESTWTFPLGNLGEIEPLLTAVREAGCVIDDLRLTQTDLEDVFLGVMQSSDRRKESAP
jgi:ABC-2 type transport system ATP-binding protein